MSAASTYDLGKLHGGLRLPSEKAASTSRKVLHSPIPVQLILPLTQHVGNPSQPIVGIGEYVLKGQLVADTDGRLGAPVHATSSGKVVAIEPWPVSRRHGDTAPCIVIECDGLDRSIETSSIIIDYKTLDPESLLLKILQGGIVGLGGAVFPTAQKLMQAVTAPLDFLILNGVECEPYISCDDMLMREHAESVLLGGQILMHALALKNCYVAVESDKPQALMALAEALGKIDDDRITIKQVPTIYPSGGEDQLVQLVTNKEVPSGGLPTDVGCVVQNVGTAAAIHDWISNGEPLISRITTVAGEGVMEPVNVRARIGTTIADVVDLAGGYSDSASQLIIGGPMCGKSVSTDRVPLVKATNCIMVLSDSTALAEEMPCIRCGECAEVCPILLLPQQLHFYSCADNEIKLREHGLVDCIECGCCDLVCPSHIPLTSDFRQAKARMRELADESSRAERARQRFEVRNIRLSEDRDQRNKELAAQKETARKIGPDAIKEIAERAKNKPTKTPDKD